MLSGWRRLGCEYRDRHSSTAEMMGEFKERLSAKRLREAKFRLLERLRAQVHKMYEDGLILPATSNARCSFVELIATAEQPPDFVRPPGSELGPLSYFATPC